MSEKPEASEKPEESETTEKPTETEKPEESETTEKPETSEKSEESENPGTSENSEISEAPEESEKPDGHVHNYYQTGIIKEPSCTETGIREYRCWCGAQYFETIDKVGHQYTVERIPATVQSSGMVREVCSVCAEVGSVTVIDSPQKMKCSKTDFVYDGKVKRPSVIVTDCVGKNLTEMRDYQVSYSGGSKNPGVYTVTVTFCGDYSGAMEETFTIRPKGVSLKKVTARSKGMQVTWERQKTQIDGYQLEYAAEKNFKGKTVKVTVANKNTTGKKISKLKGKKNYYVRIRTYKTVKVNGKKIKLYSGWSKKKTVRTKK